MGRTLPGRQLRSGEKGARQSAVGKGLLNEQIEHPFHGVE
jgi:hypothetical protein